MHGLTSSCYKVKLLYITFSNAGRPTLVHGRLVFLPTRIVSCREWARGFLYRINRAVACLRLVCRIFTARCYASAVLAMGLCLSVHVRLSMSVTSRSSTKTAKHRITQTTPHDSAGTLVFWRQRSPRNSTGVTPYRGAKCRWGGSSVYRWYTQLDRRRFVYDTLPPTNPPTSYHRFGQDLSYK